MRRAESAPPDRRADAREAAARQRARLRVYIGAAPGVGKTYSMLEDAHALSREGVDVVIGFVETYGRAETEAQIGDLEVDPAPAGSNIAASCSRRWTSTRSSRAGRSSCVVDELAHTNVPAAGTRSATRTSSRLLDAGIGVMTAVNIQHLETLNDAVSRVTGVRVRETVPDTFLDRADEVVNVDVTVEELQSRLRQGKVYKPEKVEQALTNFFREDEPVDAARAGAARGRRRRSARRRRRTASAKASSRRSSRSA